MTDKLVICEKPSQARDIAAVLGAKQSHEGYLSGNGYWVTWCLGHLLALAPPESYADNLKPWRLSALPVVPSTWQLLPNPKTKSQLSVIEKLLKKISYVLVATDADREGDVIGRELLDYFGYKGVVERLWLSALDEASIKKALAKLLPGQSTENLYQAGLGRQRADWLIGMNMTMATSALFGEAGQGVLSVGRVQSPTLNLIVERDREIENFKPKDYYELFLSLKQDDQLFKVKWQPREEYCDEAGHCLNADYVKQLLVKCQGQMASVESFSDDEKSVSAPPCFALSNLQKLCNSQLGLSAKDTLATAQSLYEKHKATTYPRTDSGYLPIAQFAEAPIILAALKKNDAAFETLIDACDTNFKSPTWDDKKVTAHHGIIPTQNSAVDIHAMSETERKVYDLIVRYYLAQFLGDYTYRLRKVGLSCQGENFTASSQTPIRQGFKAATEPAVKQKLAEEADDLSEMQTSENENMLPLLKTGERLPVVNAQIETKKTKPPARFTEGSLITAMKNIAKYVDAADLKKTLKETAGIGTEATRADIIEKLLQRQFIERQKKQLVSTEKGRSLIDLLPEMMKDPGTTALWEQKLEAIASNEATLHEFMQAQAAHLDDMLKALAKDSATKSVGDKKSHPCPLCQSPMKRRQSKKGFFWGCSSYPDCKGLCPDVDGKPVEKPKSEYSDIDCPTCKKAKLVKRQSKKGVFWGCGAYPECKAVYVDQTGKPDIISKK